MTNVTPEHVRKMIKFTNYGTPYTDSNCVLTSNHKKLPLTSLCRADPKIYPLEEYNYKIYAWPNTCEDCKIVLKQCSIVNTLTEEINGKTNT